MPETVKSNNAIIFGRAKFQIANGILHCEFFNMEMYHSLRAERAQTYIEAIKTLCQGKPTPFIIDIRNAKGTYTIEAAKLFADSPDLKFIRIAEAYILNSTAMKLLIGAYKRIYEPTTPFILVNDLEQAITYCLEAKKMYDTDN
ncbi:hypothetical protein ATE92_0736 [Ulvibacter sp. MAR_2010_11]|uniref:DUF7793 family protein n=1 Tax=Ulvibacter sp. MAR_2010_11 TaxID=1250229 RepID=UPI000C2BCAB8|nr:hypothetical protein [Ulvibacter sp. MAR_2010_11]PKA82603.1 hypothetical protein ATE92_0736 [Ulvibacter sp. MAR_2010_11]